MKKENKAALLKALRSQIMASPGRVTLEEVEIVEHTLNSGRDLGEGDGDKKPDVDYRIVIRFDETDERIDTVIFDAMAETMPDSVDMAEAAPVNPCRRGDEAREVEGMYPESMLLIARSKNRRPAIKFSENEPFTTGKALEDRLLEKPLTTDRFTANVDVKLDWYDFESDDGETHCGWSARVLSLTLDTPF